MKIVDALYTYVSTRFLQIIIIILYHINNNETKVI